MINIIIVITIIFVSITRKTGSTQSLQPAVCLFYFLATHTHTHAHAHETQSIIINPCPGEYKYTYITSVHTLRAAHSIVRAGEW